MSSIQSASKAVPVPSWARRIEIKPGRTQPQAIAHRGYKAKFPENTMAAFRGAVEVGSHAIETDLHLSRDGVVVLSHDATLKRCFGHPQKIADCDWEWLRTLHTLEGQPPQPMSRLVDLLEYMAQPEQEHIWMVLDIKTHDDMKTMLDRLATTLESVATTTERRPWHDRIILGAWDATYLSSLTHHPTLALYPSILIAYSPSYATAILHHHHHSPPSPPPHDEKSPTTETKTTTNLVGFSLGNYPFAPSRLLPRGEKFIREVQEQRQQQEQSSSSSSSLLLLFSWTDNAPEWMRLSLRRGFDAVVTDDPKKFLEICDESWFEGEKMGRRQYATVKEGLVLWGIYNLLILLDDIVRFLFFGGSPGRRVREAFFL